MKMKARKLQSAKGSWAHQQIDKTTPSTLGSLSVVEVVGDPSCEMMGMSMSYKDALRERWKPAAGLPLNQKHQHVVHIEIAGGFHG